MTTQTPLVTGLFYDYAKASSAIDDLHRRGFAREDLCVLMTEGDAQRAREFRADETGTKATEGVGVGSAVGGTVGAVLAAIAAVGTTLAFPGLGLIVAGPLAAAVAGAGAGGAVGGLVGGLVGVGIPKSRAELYEEGLKKGGVVVGVYARSGDEAGDIERMFINLGAESIRG
jgi:hypothetical protein